MKTPSGITRYDFVEKRRYLRLNAPIELTVMAGSNISKVLSKDISAEGVRFESNDRVLKNAALLEIKLDIPGTESPVHVKGKVAWSRQTSREDGAPIDYGVEFSEIEEDNKNTYLKFLCDLIYKLPEGDPK